MTQVEQRKNVQIALKGEIMKLLKWDEMQYCNFQFEQGLEYLKAYVGDQDFRLKYSRIFWNWWKNQWALRDEDILINNIDQVCVRMRVEIYEDFHNGASLVSTVHPHRHIMELTYTKMIDELIREEIATSYQKIQYKPSS